MGKYNNPYLEGQLSIFGDAYRRRNFKNYDLLPTAERNKILDAMPDYVDSLDLKTAQDTGNAIKQYYVDHLPKLTEKNYDKAKEIVLDAVEPKIKKLAYKLVNAVGTFEDYVSELNVKVLTIMEKNRDSYINGDGLDNGDISDIVHIALVSVDNYAKDLSAEFANKPDTSLYHGTDHYVNDDDEDNDVDWEDDDNDIRQSTFANQEDLVIASDLLEKLARELRFEEDGDIALKFIKECLDPSEATQQRYEAWLADPKTKIKITDRIPQRIICEELGIDFDKELPKLKEMIGFNLVALGVNTRKVFSKEYLQMSKQWWLRRGCPTPKGVEYNERGEVIKIS